jgi:hypothetical protein
MNESKVKPESSLDPEAQSASGINRRSFLGRVGGGAAATVAAAALARPRAASAQLLTTASSGPSKRVQQAYDLRVNEAKQDAQVGPRRTSTTVIRRAMPTRAARSPKPCRTTASGAWT